MHCILHKKHEDRFSHVAAQLICKEFQSYQRLASFAVVADLSHSSQLLMFYRQKKMLYQNVTTILLKCF